MALQAALWAQEPVVAEAVDMEAEAYLVLEELNQVQPAAAMLNQAYHGGYTLFRF